MGTETQLVEVLEPKPSVKRGPRGPYKKRATRIAVPESPEEALALKWRDGRKPKPKKISIKKATMEAFALGEGLREAARKAIGASATVVSAAVSKGETVNGVHPARAAELALSPGMLRVGGYADAASSNGGAVALVQLVLGQPGAAQAPALDLRASLIDAVRQSEQPQLTQRVIEASAVPVPLLPVSDDSARSASQPAPLPEPGKRS